MLLVYLLFSVQAREGEECGDIYLAASALLFGFDAPWEVGFVVGVEDVVVDLGVDVFGVYEEAVDVEDTGADGWEVGGVGFGGRHGGFEVRDL